MIETIVPVVETQTKIKNRAWILFAVSIVGLMVQVDYTAVNVGLEAMAATVHSDLTTIQWVLSAYVLAWGAMVIPAGRLADLYGNRRMFLLGNVLFLLGSILSGLATTGWFLIASRVLQGIGGAIFLPSVYTLIFTAYPNEERGKAMGVLTSAFAVGMAIGPTLGGVILHVLDWRYIFFVNIPFGIGVIGIILKTIPKEPKKLLDESLDYIGAAFLAFSLVGFMYGLTEIRNLGLFDPRALSILLGSIILLAITLLLQRRVEHPILKLSLFQNKSFLGCILSYILLGYNFASVLIIGSLYLQNIMNYSAFDTGLIFLAMTIAFGVLSTYAGRLCDVLDKRIIIVIGGLCCVIGTFMFASLTQTSPLWLICVMFALVGTGMGFAFPALNMAMMNSVGHNELNVASGTFTMFGCLGNTIGLIMSAVSIVYFGQTKLVGLFSSVNFSLDGNQIQALNQLMASAHYTTSMFNAFNPAMVPEVMRFLHQAFVHAMSRSLSIALFFSFLSIIFGVLFIKEKKHAEVD